MVTVKVTAAVAVVKATVEVMREATVD